MTLLIRFKSSTELRYQDVKYRRRNDLKIDGNKTFLTTSLPRFKSSTKLRYIHVNKRPKNDQINNASTTS